MMPEISIIIPIYNSSVFLPKCIGSILAQTFDDYELLLIDDGSTDNSLDIIQEYAEKEQRIRVFHQTNAGVGSARNIGLQEAKGKWVTFVDSDDWLDRDYLDKLRTDVEDVDFVLCGMNLIDSRGILRTSRLRKKAKPVTNNDVYLLKEIYNSLNMFSFCGPVCKLFRKEIIEYNSILFPENLSFGEDSLFVARYLHFIRKIRIVDQPLYNVLSHDGSLCATPRSPSKTLEAYQEVHRETLSFCERQNIEDRSSQEIYYVDRLLLCAERMRICPDADSYRRERYSCYNYVYNSPYKNVSGNKLTPLFFFCGAFRWWRLYDFFLSMSSYV